VFARSSTFQARPESIDDGIAYTQNEALPTLQQIDGFIGLSLLVDRTSGRCIATGAWQSEDAMRASADRVSTIRDRAAEVFGSGPTEVDEWEITAMHRDHRAPDGACSRLTWLTLEPNNADRATDVFKMSVLPQIEQMDGFCSASLLLNRTAGRAVSTVTFDSLAALERTREQANAIRANASREAVAQIRDVSEFELATAHLRVPELV
jgi:heme-degrading monooxygenase HmoA